MNEPTRPGEIVRLKSGGPIMTTAKAAINAHLICLWFTSDGLLQEREIPAAALKIVKPEEEVIKRAV